ncbi:YigZ family protein [Thiofilum flexile]|uniref:YigZ family protein n=1 Tax=Thiofilum flexile TaxID=125627 RepID=UPI00037A6FA4|nr:YigZ family protein [Thiofilum flexile]
MNQGYFIPMTHHKVETEIKRSQFITHIGHVSNRPEAEAFIKQLRLTHPQATHVCWAYIAGAPNTTVMSMSDDGEPNGTAGRPMLNALQYSGLGEIVAVVVRYFGGTKLGTGGLQRAYGGCVKEALLTLPTQEKIAQVSLLIECGYEFEALVRHVLQQYNALLEQCDYGQNITLQLQVALEQVNALTAELTNRSSGAIHSKLLNNIR